MLSNAVNALTLGLVASLAAPVSAFIAFDCQGPVVEERADPIVNPGGVSGHVHKIAGGNAFGFTMDYAQARSSSCSSCPIKQDLSNYWTPKLYYQAADGTFQSVPHQNDGFADLNGGMRIYYFPRGDKSKPINPFPEGFRMVAGNPFLRHNAGGPESRKVNFACIGDQYRRGETPYIPNYNCPGGLRAQVYFPSCWDGKNLDSPDHRSHMAYPDGDKCPSSHPVQFPHLFYEVNYGIDKFKDKWYGDKHPFVFAQGDATGYGFHGDFLNGWDVNTLGRVIKECAVDANQGSIKKDHCKPIDTFTDAQMQSCKIPSHVNEEVRGVLPRLPGCNSVSRGPADATPVTDCAVTAISPAKTYYKDMTSEGWAYAGCASDGDPRTLSSKTSIYLPGVGKNMTIEYCLDFCEGYTYAGLEYADQCFCGNSVTQDRAPVTGILGNCNMRCAGDSTEYCGGPRALSLYKKCSGSDCSNTEYQSITSSLTSKAKRHIHHPHGRVESF